MCVSVWFFGRGEERRIVLGILKEDKHLIGLIHIGCADRILHRKIIR